MKNQISKFFAAALVWLALSLSMQAASQLYFGAAQGTGTQNPTTYGSVSIDNPTYAGSAWWVTGQASAIYMVFYHEDTALFQATVDTDYDTGNHFIGQFWLGADCYVSIY